MTSTAYGSPAFSGIPSNPVFPQRTIDNLLDGTTYGFIATTFDSSRNESPTSNEFIITTLPKNEINKVGNSSSIGRTLLASIRSPIPDWNLTSTTIPFTEGHHSGKTLHSLWIGTTKGGRNLFIGPLSDHAQLVSGLPENGTIYLCYWNNNNSSDPKAWSFTDQTYTMTVSNVSFTRTPSISPPPISLR